MLDTQYCLPPLRSNHTQPRQEDDMTAVKGGGEARWQGGKVARWQVWLVAGRCKSRSTYVAHAREVCLLCISLVPAHADWQVNGRA